MNICFLSCFSVNEENTSNNVYIYIGLGITLMLGIAIAIVGFGIYQTKHTGNVLGNKILDLYYRLTKYYVLNIFACDSIHVYGNICSLVINHGDKTVSKLYRK